MKTTRTIRRTRTGGFSIVEVLVSVTVFLLGVISTGAVMINIQKAAAESETRYRDNADLRVKVESIKTGMTAIPANLLKTIKEFKLSTGDTAITNYELVSGGLPNLIRLEFLVNQDKGGNPIQFVTYLRADDN